MDEKSMIDDLVAQLDAGMSNGVGHLNLDIESTTEEAVRNVKTMGCTDCSKAPLACSVPTIHDAIDDFNEKRR